MSQRLGQLLEEKINDPQIPLQPHRTNLATIAAEAPHSIRLLPVPTGQLNIRTII
jgi:hypothetical protein